jgi:hypothetical protein
MDNPDIGDLKGQIADLETEVRTLKDDKKQLRDALDDALETGDKMREHVESVDSTIENWIEYFDMEQREDDAWFWDKDQTELWVKHYDLVGEHHKLVRQWNKFVGQYNSTAAPRNLGRPLQASPAQVQDVRHRHKNGASLRGIAKDTGLSLRTVRTILDQGSDRERTRTNVLRRESFDKMAAADFKAKKRGREYLEKQINRVLKDGVELVKAAKGLGKT